MKQKGFTLVEMIVTVSIASVMFVSLIVMVVAVYRANSAALLQTQIIDSARQGVETWTRDVREIDFGINGQYPIQLATPDQFHFYADIDPDDVTEFIEYSLASSSLVRSVYSATGTPPVYASTPDTTNILSSNIENNALGQPTFSYFDSANVEVSDTVANVADIRFVRIELQIDNQDPAATSTFQLTGSATLRNLRDAL